MKPSPERELMLLDWSKNDDYLVRSGAFVGLQRAGDRHLALLRDAVARDPDTFVQKQVVTGLPRKLRPQDLGVKKGPFYVLFLSNMPAILVEVGFLTHRGEAKRLRDEGYLKDMATQIAEGLVLYKGEQDTRLARTGSS